MSNKQSLQIQSAESAFKLIGPMLVSLLQIKFSERHNALYGKADFFGRLFNMCIVIRIKIRKTHRDILTGWFIQQAGSHTPVFRIFNRNTMHPFAFPAKSMRIGISGEMPCSSQYLRIFWVS